MATTDRSEQPSNYLDFYKYLLVLTEAQIIKLRKVAVGILSMSAFTSAEINELEQHLQRSTTKLN